MSLSPQNPETTPTSTTKFAPDPPFVATLDSAESGFTAPRVAALMILALLPFWAIPFAHVISNPDTATGFFHYELPYYVANGRAAFERGNGVLYPNPYDPSAEAPAIYAHWLPWTFGLLTAGLGVDPGDMILTFTFFASLGFAVTTWMLVRERTTGRSDQANGFLIAMLGGGILCAGGLLLGTATNTVSPTAALDRMLSFDPGKGMWFLNWGRNALFPTEAIYHSLVALCWIAEIRQRPRLANVFMFLLATTHPWSGIELLLTINLWRGVCFLRQRDADTRNQLSISAGALIVFLIYYKVWLPTFPSHAELQSVWELNWRLSAGSAFLAYVPVLIPCVIQLRQAWQSGVWRRSEQFLLCALTVAAGLAFHDRLIKPVQPLHFTRGYLWMPLLLLGLPVLLNWWNHVRQHSFGGALLAVSVAVLMMSDNLVFSVLHCHRQLTAEDGFHLDSDERAMLRQLNSDEFAGGVIVTESATLNYLLPAYASVRPWLGHQFNTPNFADRKATWLHSMRDDDVDLSWISDDVDTIVIRRDRNDSSLQAAPDWQRKSLQNAVWRSWSRNRQASTTTSTQRHLTGHGTETAGFGKNLH